MFWSVSESSNDMISSEVRGVFSQYLQSETLSLDEVSKELIGEHKEDFNFVRLSNMRER